MSSDELTTIAQKAARGGLFLFFGNASSTMILAVGIIIVARLLGPSSYGLYTLALVIPTLLVSLSDAGMNFALVNLPARLRAEGDFARANRFIRLGLLLKLAISTVAFILCYLGLIQLGGAGVGVLSLIIEGLLYLAVYLTLAPILGAMDKQDILNLKTLLGGTRIVATFVNPVFDYESKLLSALGRN